MAGGDFNYVITTFLKPVLPPPVVEIVGGSPIATALDELCSVLGYATRRSLPESAPEPTAAVVIASHGRDEQESIRRALDAGVPYIALVASPRRGAAVLDEMGLSCCERGRISSPAGLDLGSRTAGEVAVSILAELIGRLRHGELRDPSSAAGATDQDETTVSAETPTVQIDPVCGMSVVPGAGVPHLETEEGTVWFCNPGCRDRHAAELGLS